MYLRHIVPKPLRKALRPVRRMLLPPRPTVLGYLRECSTSHVAGWIQNHDDPGQRVAFEVVCTLPGATRVLATGVADLFDPVLSAQGVGDAHYGFRVTFPTPVSESERDRIEVRPIATRKPIQHEPPTLLGYLRERSTTHVAGWIQNQYDPSQRVAFEVVCTLRGAQRVLATGVADLFDPVLSAQEVGDALYGFRVAFPTPVSEAERDHLEVRPIATGKPIQRAPSPILGYLQECSTSHVAGWIHNHDDPGQRVAFQVVCAQPGAERVLATGVADQLDSVLSRQGVGDGRYGFRVAFPAPVSEPERDHIEVRPIAAGKPIQRAPSAILGYIRERSTRHVAGWIQNAATPTRRVAFEVVCTLPGSERVLATGVADQFDRVLSALGFGDALYGFRVIYPEPVSGLERDHVEVRPVATGTPIPLDQALRATWQPIRYIAMDIVDNCNLRCPFCLFDHAPVHRTNVMDDAVFESALRLLPFVGPEGFWMSCLHEPTMHPRITEFINRIPREHRHVMSYTTNLAKRMPDSYFATLANSGLDNLNVSIESRDPAIYERMRKGARHRIFMENWDKLLAAFATGSAPPPLRYIAMAYKSNLREIPSLIEYLRNERRAWKIEIRDTYNVPHIEQEFRDAEFLDRADWLWLQAALARYAPHEVSLVLPPDFAAVAPAPDAAAPAAPPRPDSGSAEARQSAMAAEAPGLLEARMFHDGSMIVYTSPLGNYPNYGTELVRTNIRDIADPGAFLMSLLEGQRSH
ncbi:radical SAM protein [Limobrevibacterium gyesilva]|uniref:Radical SAM protein n=1 Tax=Limobrevibacterium gyesilva TaxID=2991712 RepID=A0AA41YVK9_9PROT|nr:radical SAM protein [Limobrevibacterium gyesilva]MCW3476202.1 radical SAM protein [Limobrevibacterium gyesilva]